MLLQQADSGFSRGDQKMNKKGLIGLIIGVIILVSAFMIGGSNSTMFNQTFSDGSMNANVSGTSTLYDKDGNVIADLGIVPGALSMDGVVASYIFVNYTFTVDGEEVDWGSYKLSLIKAITVQKNGGEAKQVGSSSSVFFERSQAFSDKVLIDAGAINALLGGLEDEDQVRFKYSLSFLVTARSVYGENLTAQAVLASYFDLKWDEPMIELEVDNTGSSGTSYTNPWGMTTEVASIGGGSSATLPLAVLGLAIMAISLYFSKKGKRIF